MFIEVLGWAAAACGAVVALPQVVRLFRSGTAAGISTMAWQITFGANIAWSAHGIHAHHANVWVPNMLFLVYSTLVLLQLRRHRGTSLVSLLGPGLVLAAVSFGLDLTAGPVAFAVAAFLPSALSQVAQLQALFIAPNIRGVSMTYLMMNVANQVLWVSWAVSVGEVSVTLVGSSLGVLMSLNLVVAVLRRTNLVRARLADLSA